MMAFTKKPLEWNAVGVEPNQEKKDQGFGNGEYPAAGHFDFKFNSDYEVLKELQEKAGEVKTVNGQLPDTNGNVNVNVDTSGFVTTQTFDEHKTDLAHVHWIGTAIGTNALTATYAPITEYKEGLGVAFKNSTASTGSTTLSINGLGVIPILKSNGSAVTNLKANGVYTLRYSSGNFILQGEGGSGNATASDLLSGKTASTDAGDITGTIPSKGTQTYTPGTTNQTIAANQFLSGIQTILGDPDLVASNIKSGVNIFGVLGTLDITSLGGKRWSSGITNVINTSILFDYADGSPGNTFFYIDISGISFKPSIIIAFKQTTTTRFDITLVYENNIYCAPFTGGATNTSTYHFKVSGNAIVDAGKFKIPILNSGDVTWIAIE